MKLILTSDLHQWLPKWKDLVGMVCVELPRFVLVAGDLLPKQGGYPEQRRFFAALRRYFQQIKDTSGATVLAYLGNDDYHLLEPLLDELAADGLCVNLNGRIHREAGLVFGGMNKVRDYPFGYKHWCARDANYGACPVQLCGEGVTLDPAGEFVPLASLVDYLAGKPSLGEEMEHVIRQLQPGEMPRSIWMIHQPPSALGMDILFDGQQVGSPTVLDFIRRHAPLLGCSGHIHESPHQPGGRWGAQVGRTFWFQPGQVDRRLHCVVVEVDSQCEVRSARHSIFGEWALPSRTGMPERGSLHDPAP